MIRFHCAQCGKKLKADDKQVGSRFKCSRCQAQGVVPSHSSHQETQDLAPEPPITFGRNRDADEEVDMTPMVDVTFLLLIFFMITAAFASQKSLEIPPPDIQEAVSKQQTVEEMEQDDDYIIVRIDGDNVIWVNNESEAPTRQELIAKLREARQGSSRPPSNLLVLAHGDSVHETVVMVLDVGNALGIENIRLATDDGEL